MIRIKIAKSTILLALLSCVSFSVFASEDGMHFFGISEEGQVLVGKDSQSAGASSQGIRQGGVRGIRQGGVRGIRQGGVRGIRQGGVRGIRQGGVRGIRQGGVRGIRQGGVRGTSELDFSNNPIPLIAIGPLQKAEDDSLVVLGQSILTDDETIFIDAVTGDEIIFENIELGSFLLIAGDTMGPGQQIATVVSVLKSDYVPGSDSIYIRASLSGADNLIARATSGKTSIDYSQSLFDSELTALTGNETIEFFGTTGSAWSEIQASSGTVLQ
jgi:hypothetical protein